MDTVEIILDTLKRHLPEIRSLGVERIGVFGSMATGSNGPDSDIDILVSFVSGRKSFDSYMDLKFRLEELLPGHKIDLVLENALKPAVRPHVERSVRYVA